MITDKYVSVTDARLAACLLALGFPGGLHATTHSGTRKTQVEVQVELDSTRFPMLALRPMLAAWNEGRVVRHGVLVHLGRLEVEEPMHMLCVMMRAQGSYDAFLKLQAEGGGMVLMGERTTAEDPCPIAYRYEPAAHMMTAFAGTVIEDDLKLAAALGPLGVPLVKLHGSRGQHRYEMAGMGLPVKLSDGTFHQHAEAELVRRLPDGRYVLEVEQPHHPLISGLEALEARGVLKAEIMKITPSLMVTADNGSTRQALIAINAAGHVARAVERHFKAPPGSLDL